LQLLASKLRTTAYILRRTIQTSFKNEFFPFWLGREKNQNIKWPRMLLALSPGWTWLGKVEYKKYKNNIKKKFVCQSSSSLAVVPGTGFTKKSIKKI
jgi:hypothetical protein